jgi:hypothetical protein
MLKFITDVQGDEPDILTPIKDNSLVVTDLEKNKLFVEPAPHGGWTDKLLWDVSEKSVERTINGADAYLGDVWVGSTEV